MAVEPIIEDPLIPPTRDPTPAPSPPAKIVSLHRFLTRMIWLCVTPLVLLVLGFAFVHVRSLEYQRDRDARDRLHNLAESIDRVLLTRTAALEVLAGSRMLDDPLQEAEFHLRAKGFQDLFGSRVILADTERRILLHSAVPHGTPLPMLPRPKGRSAVDEVLATGKPAVGDMFPALSAREQLVAIAAPVVREGMLRYFLLTVLETAAFGKVLDGFSIPSEWSLTLLDGKGDVIARKAPSRKSGFPGEWGANRRFTADCTNAKWSVVLEIPPSVFLEPILVASAASFAAILLFTLAGVLAGRIAGRKLAVSVGGLAKPTDPDGPPVPDIEEIEAVRVLLDESAAAQRSAESTLRESEERYRVLLESAPVGVAVFQRNTLVFANPAWSKLLGGDSPHQVLGKSVGEIVPPGKAAGARDRMREILARDTPSRCTFTRLDGSAIVLEVVASPLTFEGRPAIQVIASDITDREKSEAALAASEKKYRQLSQEFHGLLDAIPDRLMLLDRDLKILWSNRACDSPSDESLESLGESHCFLGQHDPAKPCEHCPALATLQSGHPQSAVIQLQGDRTWDVRTIPLSDEGGGIGRVIVVCRDITEQRRLEASYLQAQKMESIGTLAGGVAHDFNNILSAIIGYGQLAAMNLGPDDGNRQNIDHMLEAADRAAHLTRQLLLFSRKQTGERKIVDLNTIVRKVEKFLRRVIGEDISCRFLTCTHLHDDPGTGESGGEDEPLMVLADGHQIEQVLMNLATNARDAMPKGGNFTVTTRKVRLDKALAGALGCAKPGAHALLTASDTGAGMDAETARRIFEPFFTTKEPGRGTGLGLSVVYGIVNQHGGCIEVGSEPGRGTTFRIYLPLSAAKSRKEAPAGPHRKPAGGTETILVAEDSESIRKLYHTILTSGGYTVIEAVDGEDAVRKFREHGDSVDLLLLDIIMPKMNGKEAFEEIRRMRPGIKAVFSSGYDPDVVNQIAGQDIVSNLIRKPFTPNDLLRKIREVLDGDTPDPTRGG